MSMDTSTATPLPAEGVADRVGDFDSVPVIDFGGMLKGDAASKAQVATALKEACTNVGFFYITNHGVPRSLVDEMFAENVRFFQLPLEEKKRLYVKNSPHLLGYVGLQDENLDPLAGGKGDFHEAFDFVPPDLEIDGKIVPGDFRQVGNLLPENLPGFQEVMTRYSIAMKRLSRQLFNAFALALDLPENYFEEMTNGAMTLIRILYYPHQPGPLDETRLGTGAHTDHECFTILFQDEIPALQVQNRHGTWIDAPRIPGTFIVNIGDQMARWTNGTFASTLHRVANMSGRARYSIPCFVGANADAVIEALPSCVSPENPAKFPPVVAGEYVSALIHHHFSDNPAQHSLKKGMVEAR
jgi:isopenicillin N synthase-like dioxygenase